MTMVITGIGVIQYNPAEYVDQPVVESFNSYINTIKSIFDQRDSNPAYNGTAPPLTSTDYQQLISAVNGLTDLAKNGLSITTSPPPLTYTGFISQNMASSLDLIVRSLQAAGINPSSTAVLSSDEQVLLLQNWQSLAGYGVEQILESALNPSFSVYYTRTLQSMVELEYVKEGNDLIYSNLSFLEDALSTSDDILKTMTVVQNISNEISVASPRAFAFPPSSNGQIPITAQTLIFNSADDTGEDDIVTAYIADHNLAHANALARNPQDQAELDQFTQEEFDKLSDFAQAIKDAVKGSNTLFERYYKMAASTQFTQVSPTPNPTSTAADELLTAKNSLMSELASLEAQNPEATRSVVNSLAYFVYRVALDISAAFVGVNVSNVSAMTKAVTTWIMDNQDKALASPQAQDTGAIQQNITQAIQAAESLNDTQKQEVNRYMFLFQQFYTSSSAILQKVTQIIERMAQKIAQ